MKKAVVTGLLALILLTALAGCVNSSGDSKKATGTATTKGVEITEFSALPYIDSGEFLDVNLYAQNQGGNKATNVKAELYQLSGFAQQGEPKTESGSLLYPPSKELDMPGDTFSQYWSLKAPSTDVDKERSFLCKLSYDYVSTASTNIQLVTKDEWDRRGGASAFTTYSSSTEAPMTLEILPVPAVRVGALENNAKKIPLDIVIKNTGSGLVEEKILNNFELYVKKGQDFIKFSEGSTTYNTFLPTKNAEGGVVPSSGIECSSVETDYNTAEPGSIILFGIEQARSMRCYLTLPFDETEGYAGYVVEASVKYTYTTHSKPLSIMVRKLQ